MIPWLRLAPYIAVVLLLAGGIWYVHHKGYTSGYDDGHREFLDSPPRVIPIAAPCPKIPSPPSELMQPPRSVDLLKSYEDVKRTVQP